MFKKTKKYKTWWPYSNEDRGKWRPKKYKVILLKIKECGTAETVMDINCSKLPPEMHIHGRKQID